MKKIFLFALALAMTANVLAQFNPRTTPLTLEARDANTQIKVLNQSAGAFEYQINGQGAKQSIAANAPEVTINLPNVGDYVQLWGYQSTTCAGAASHISVPSGFAYVYGNAMSLVEYGGQEYENMWLLQQSGTFYQLFYQVTSLDIHPTKDLVLPATKLSKSCYEQMFYGCTGLTKVPALPATTLAESCYDYMFWGCTGLIQAQDTLPAMTLAPSCYKGMFNNCTGLTKAPELPATTVAEYCYYNMFYGCAGLTQVPDTLPAMTLEPYCYKSMFYYCSSLTQAPALPAKILANECYSSMFYYCTNLTQAPVLPATTLYPSCYTYMFFHCESLNRVECYAITFADNSTYRWLSSVAATGTFVKATAATDWTLDSRDGIPANWTVQEVDVDEDDPSITPQAPATPVISLPSGYLVDTATIALTCETEGASIYYTLDGSAPSATNGTLYTTPISVNVTASTESGTLTLKAIAVTEEASSEIATSGYTLRRTTCTFGVTYNNAAFGSISIPESAKYGDEVTITVNPNEGYVLDYITIPEGSIGTLTENKFVIPAHVGLIHLYVYFKQATLTVTATAGEHGSVYATTVSGQPIDLSNPLTYGQKIYLHATPDEGYEVDEWTNYNPMTGLTVTASVTVTVTFKKQAYHVRFVDYDNTVLKEEDVLYQESATAPADPTRNGYTFAGWDKDFSSITAAITVKATYTVNSYLVTVVANHGTVTAKDIENNPRDLSQPVEYGTVLLLTATPDENWLFDHWENYDHTTGLTVTGNITVTAVFRKHSYTVTFMDYDFTVLKEEEVLHGEAATAPADPTREGYTFTGWDTDFSYITDYTIVKATYTINSYMVTVVAEHGTVTATDGDNNPMDLSQPIQYGKVVWLIATPDDRYEMIGWTNYDPVTGLTVKEDVTVTATFRQSLFHVTFVDWDDTVLKEEDVRYEEAATAPADPAREGYRFTGWDKDFSAVKEDMTVKAQYEKLSEGFESVFSGENAAKILRNGQILILRGDRTYTLTGAEVK